MFLKKMLHIRNMRCQRWQRELVNLRVLYYMLESVTVTFKRDIHRINFYLPLVIRKIYKFFAMRACAL